MPNDFNAAFSATLVLYCAVCGLSAPAIGYALWLEKRDCELLNQTKCAWQMLPKENDDE